MRLACPEPLFVAPIKPADRSGSRIVACLAQCKFAGNATNLRVGEVAYQLLNRARRNLGPDVDEEDHVCRGLRHAGIDGDRLADVLLRTIVFRSGCCWLASNSAVPSVEPSETMMISLMFR